MPTSRLEINKDTGDLERPGDQYDDLSYIPKPLGPAAVEEEVVVPKRRDELVDEFIEANLGFVPESRSALALAPVSVEDAVETIYKKTVKYDKHRPEIRANEIREYYKKLSARESWSRLELEELTNANSTIEELRFDPSTFRPDYLRSSHTAMDVVALHQLRATALATGNWSKLDVTNKEKSIHEEVDFMHTLKDEELTVRWNAAWESTNNEYAHWTRMVNEIKENQAASFYLPASAFIS